MNSRYLSLVLLLLTVSVAAWISSQFMAGIWYFDMDKPAWTPTPIAWAVAWGAS